MIAHASQFSSAYISVEILSVFQTRWRAELIAEKRKILLDMAIVSILIEKKVAYYRFTGCWWVELYSTYILSVYYIFKNVPTIFPTVLYLISSSWWYFELDQQRQLQKQVQCFCWHCIPNIFFSCHFPLKKVSTQAARHNFASGLWNTINYSRVSKHHTATDFSVLAASVWGQHSPCMSNTLLCPTCRVLTHVTNDLRQHNRKVCCLCQHLGGRLRDP